MVEGMSIETAEKVNEILGVLNKTSLSNAKQIAQELVKIIDIRIEKTINRTLVSD